MKYYSLDFNIIHEKTKSQERAYVKGWLLEDIYTPDDFYFGDSIDELIEILKDLKEENTIYTTNLKVYGEFFFIYLLEHNFECIRDKLDIKLNTFLPLISDLGKFYLINIYLNEKRGKYLKTKILDIRNVIDYETEDLCECFLGEKYIEKTDIFERLRENAKIIGKVAVKLKEHKLDKMTIGSNALAHYKKMIGNFDFYYPEIVEETYNYIRDAYKGGFCYLTPEYASKTKGRGIVLDINSAYAERLKNARLPIGEPVFFMGKYEENPLYDRFIQRITCSFKLKEGKLPSIQIRKNIEYDPGEWIRDSHGDMLTLTLCDIDLKLFFENYEIEEEDLKFEDGMMFKSCVGLFDEYINYWYDLKLKAKKEGNLPLYEIAKGMLNSLYGKFGTIPKGRSKYPELTEDGTIRYIMSLPEPRKTVYIPVAAFVTAETRYKLIKDSEKIMAYTIKKYGKNLHVYNDTDSLHVLLQDENELKDIIDLDKEKLGAYKVEVRFSSGRWLRQKVYVLNIEKEKKINLKLAGATKKYRFKGKLVNTRDEVKFNDIKLGTHISGGKTKYKHIPGGVVKVQDEYIIGG